MSSGPSTEGDLQMGSGPPAPPAAVGTDIDVAPVAASGSQAPAATRAAKRKRSGLSFLQELPFLLLVAFVLALLIKTFLVQAFYIPSESMEPTLHIGDRVLVNKVVYHLHSPRR